MSLFKRRFKRRLPVSKRQTIKNHLQESQLFMQRMWIAVIAMVILMLFLVLRLFYIQIIQHDVYITLSKENQFNLIPIEPTRGLIYDRNGVLLAQNQPIFSLEITPNHIKNIDQTIGALQKIIDITPDDIYQFRKALRQRRTFDTVPLKMKLTDEEVARFYVNQFLYPGVSVNARLLRYYPYGPSFSSVIGYVGRITEEDLKKIELANYSASNYLGKAGIEKSYENRLHGTVGYQQVEMNANGQVVHVMKRIPTIPGENIYLSIDSRLQFAAEQALGDIDGAIVVIQPKTGQVLALVSHPSYDPNLFVRGVTPAEFQAMQNDPNRPLFNRALRGQFPIASTIKPYMALGGLDYGVITPTYSIQDPGWFQLPGAEHVYHDWQWPKGHGQVNAYKAIVVSCDTYMFGLGVKLGIDRMGENLRRFGFGAKTGIDVDDELPGLIPTPAWKERARGSQWFTGDTVVASIGQGYMLSTPLQLAQAVAIMANRGVRYKPTLLYKSKKPDGTFVEQAPIPEDPVVLSDPKIWDLVIEGMHGVTQNGEGTAYRYWADAPYAAAGKTGTAQLYRRDKPGKVDQSTIPYNLRNHSLFIAFAPINDPQIAIGVVAEHSLIPASAIARKVVDFYLLTAKQPPIQSRAEEKNTNINANVVQCARSLNDLYNPYMPHYYQYQGTAEKVSDTAIISLKWREAEAIRKWAQYYCAELKIPNERTHLLDDKELTIIFTQINLFLSKWYEPNVVKQAAPKNTNDNPPAPVKPKLNLRVMAKPAPPPTNPKMPDRIETLAKGIEGLRIHAPQGNADNKPIEQIGNLPTFTA